MANIADTGPADGISWNPGKFALWSQRWGSSNSISVLLRHPTAPFPSTPLPYVVAAIDDNTMRDLANRYLTEVTNNKDIDPPVRLPDAWMTALGSDSHPTLRWLPIHRAPADRDEDNSGDPHVSFRAERFSPRGEKLPDETVILLASEGLELEVNGKPRFVALGSEFGIRVVAHAQKQKDGQFQVRITGMTALIPFNFPSLSTLGLGLSDPTELDPFVGALSASALKAIKTEMTNTLALESESVKIRGVRFAQIDHAVQVEWRGSGEATATGRQADVTPYLYVFVQKKTSEPAAFVRKVALVADQIPGNARVFPRDPASQAGPTDIRERRPTRSEKAFENFRFEEQIAAGTPGRLAFPPNVPDPQIEMKVAVCPRFVLADRQPPVLPGSVKQVGLPDTGYDTPYVRSDDFAAISAFNNVREFFQRLVAYGLGVDPYFRIARLPLTVFYRSGIEPGPGKDGQTVNARVRVKDWSADFIGPVQPDERPLVEMHLALADLSTRARRPWGGTLRSVVEPLGIAADARCIWHEIGHVLLIASVGELEFRFAHSAGDALAAIVADPQSSLAADANWRGVTFPWVFLPRRHDRCVSQGWGWGGSLHYAMSQVPDDTPPRRKGYWTEQILSSSLFRLYRCIGGDTRMTTPAGGRGESTRESASHYSVYLIMKGIQILGVAGVVPTNEPDQFVAALIDADIGTPQWNVQWNLQWDTLFPPLPPPPSTPFSFSRVGGCVHKVICWAFEAQGMYTESGTITNAIGHPPRVDVYIRDQRPASETTPYGDVDYGEGSYVPVSLEWNPNQSGSDDSPKWQADRTNGIAVNGNQIRVTVGNRGSQRAINVQVSVWFCLWPPGAPPNWDSAAWTACNPSPSAAQSVDPGAHITFGPFTFAPPPSRYLVLAEATCPDDRANTDSAPLLPCSLLPTPLLDLVANDNNLGLLVLGQNA